MIIGYRLIDSGGNSPDCFIPYEMFEFRDDADSWRSSNDGDWYIIPVTKQEMEGKDINYIE